MALGRIKEIVVDARSNSPLSPVAETLDLRNGSTLAAFFYKALNSPLFPFAHRPTQDASFASGAEDGVFSRVERQVRLALGGLERATVRLPALILRQWSGPAPYLPSPRNSFSHGHHWSPP